MVKRFCKNFLVRTFAIGIIFLAALFGIHKEAAYANSSWKCQNTGVDVIGGRAVCAQVRGSGLAVGHILVVDAMAPNAERQNFFWNAQIVGGPNNDWVATWPGEGEAYSYPSLPTGGNYGYWAGCPIEVGGGYIAQITPSIETPGGVLTVRWTIEGYFDTSEGEVAGIIDQGAISFNIFNSSLSPA